MRLFSRFICLSGVIAALLAGAGAANADWREDIGALRIGILAQGDARKAVAQAEPFRLAVAEKLGIAVEIFAARDYAALVDATASARIEYAVLSATAYALAWNRCECIEPLAIARSGDGSSEIHEVIITRQDGPSSLEELRGKHIAATRAKAFGGLDVALRQMRKEGLDAAGGEAQLAPLERSDLAIAALREGSADALIGWSSMFGTPEDGYSRGTLRKLGEIEGEASGYQIVWQSVALPHRVHAVRRNLPGEARSQLRDLLAALFDNDPVAYDAIEPVYGGGFIPARQGQFEPLAALLKDEPEQAGGDGGETDKIAAGTIPGEAAKENPGKSDD